MMGKRELLEKLLADLRLNLGDINAAPWPRPSDIKTAVNTTFQIIEILIAESANGQG